jgi:excisionase family DNA binding protein
MSEENEGIEMYTTVAAAAAKRGVSKQTVYDWANTGRVHSRKLGEIRLVRLADVMAQEIDATRQGRGQGRKPAPKRQE